MSDDNLLDCILMEYIASVLTPQLQLLEMNSNNSASFTRKS